MNPVYIYGDYDRPHTWTITEEKMSPFIEKEGKFCLEFDDYEAARKWAVRDLTNKRHLIGKTMDLWLRRRTNPLHSSSQMSGSIASLTHPSPNLSRLAPSDPSLQPAPIS